jgi:hypothetical protein
MAGPSKKPSQPWRRNEVSKFTSLSCSLLLALAGSLSAAETQLITNTTA